jgi:hypothetical protein
MKGDGQVKFACIMNQLAELEMLDLLAKLTKVTQLSQAAVARKSSYDPTVGRRHEVFLQGCTRRWFSNMHMDN